jgi:hypothetical protein
VNISVDPPMARRVAIDLFVSSSVPSVSSVANNSSQAGKRVNGEAGKTTAWRAGEEASSWKNGCKLSVICNKDSSKSGIGLCPTGQA